MLYYNNNDGMIYLLDMINNINYKTIEDVRKKLDSEIC